MSNQLTPQDSAEGTDIPLDRGISRSPAVAMGNFGDGLIPLWTGFVLNLSGFYPLIIFLTTISDPSFLKTLGAWALVVFPLFIGVVVGAFGIKERGYQSGPFRIFGIASLSFGAFCLLLPAIASLLYANTPG